MNRHTPFALLVLAAFPTVARAEPPTPGIYGNVALSEESGDLGGAEIELIGSGADARVEFVLCEGWCNAVQKAPARLTEDGFEFSYTEDYVDQDGKPAQSDSFLAEVVRKGDGVSITIRYADRPDQFFGFDLPRIERRFGLAVAAGDD